MQDVRLARVADNTKLLWVVRSTQRPRSDARSASSDSEGLKRMEPPQTASVHDEKTYMSRRRAAEGASAGTALVSHEDERGG